MTFSTDNIITLLAAVLAFAASIIAAVIAVYNRRFMQEKWWERKSEAYARIIEALSEMIDYYQQMSDDVLGLVELSQDKKQEINERWKQAHRQVVKATNLGAFIVSAESEAYLRRFLKKSTEKPNFEGLYEEIEYDYANVQECLSQLISCAKKDLRV